MPAPKVGIQADYVILNLVAPADVPNGSLFLNSSNNNVPTVKDLAGKLTAVSETTITKMMVAGGAIPVNSTVSKRPDGKIVVATSDGVSTQQVIGHALEAALLNGDLVKVLMVGANLAGVVTGLNLVPGDDVFIDESGGYTGNPGTFTGSNDSIIRAGIADCAAGIASNVATDLIVMTDVLLRPLM